MDRISFQQASDLASKLLKNGFKPIEKGKNNWVFEGANRILSIPRHTRVKSYAIRVAATYKLASEGVPVAEILEYFEGNEEIPEYLIVRKIDGANVDLKGISETERECMHYSAGEILNRIHRINIEGYGRLEADLKGNKLSWKDFLDSFFEESLGRVKQNPELSDRYASILIEEYNKGKENIMPLKNSSFLHADFHLGNLLFKNGKVVAVLDLDIVTSGDPNWDTGHYCHTFNIDRINGVVSFRKGYGKDVDLEAERLYCLIIWTRKIGSQAMQRPEALKETIPELERIIGGKIW